MNPAKRSTPLVAGSLTLVLCLAFVPDAYAHARLVKSEPARRATVTEAPKGVRLCFNEQIEGEYATLSVTNSADKPVTDAKPELAADDRKCLVIALPPLSPGKYGVKFRVLSVDGHVVQSSYDFTVQERAPEK